MSDSKYRRSNPSVSGYQFAIFILVCLLIASFLNSSRLTKEEIALYENAIEDARQEGYDNGYNAGRDTGYEDGYADASPNETFQSDEMYWPHEEVCNIFVYGFQRGYENCKNGVWDEMTEEYVDGYLFHESEVEIYKHYFEWR